VRQALKSTGVVACAVGYLALGASGLFGQTNVFPSSGPVGLGTTSPMYGAIQINGLNTNGWGQVTFFDSANSPNAGGIGLSDGTHHIAVPDSAGDLVMWSSAEMHFASGNAGANQLLIPANGQATVNFNGGWGQLIFQNSSTGGKALMGVSAGNQVISGDSAGDFAVVNVAGGGMNFSNGGQKAQLTIAANGNVGVGIKNPQSALAVNGTVTTKEVVVTATGWPDFVFSPEYRLTPLSEVAEFIGKNHHLPGVPSADDVRVKGVGLAEMQEKLLTKIEELTLHLIAEKQRNDRLEDRNRDVLKRLDALEKASRQ